VRWLPVGLFVGLGGSLVDNPSRKAQTTASDVGRLAVFAAFLFAARPSPSSRWPPRPAFATRYSGRRCRRAEPRAGRGARVGERVLESSSGRRRAQANRRRRNRRGLRRGRACWADAATFAVSALLVARVPARLLQGRPLGRGHWRDLVDGFAVVRGSPAFCVLVT